MSRRKVLFATDPERFFGHVLERIVSIEASLDVVVREMAGLQSALSGREEEAIRGRLLEDIRRRKEELSARVIAVLTEDPSRDVLGSVLGDGHE